LILNTPYPKPSAMSNWKIKRSRKAGTIPHVGQFPDSDTVIWNQTDARLWGLRVDGSGNKTVVLIGGGINTIGETHQRLHAMDSEADHAAAQPADYGKVVRAHTATGLPVFAPVMYVVDEIPAPYTGTHGDIFLVPLEKLDLPYDLPFDLSADIDDNTDLPYDLPFYIEPKNIEHL